MMNVKRLLKRLFFVRGGVKFTKLLRVKRRCSRGNSVVLNSMIREGGRIYIQKSNNSIEIEEQAVIKKIDIKIFGSDNKVIIKPGVYIEDCTIHIEDDNNVVIIGENTKLCGKISISCIEGTKAEIGRDCLFSSGIDIRTGDGHALLDMQGRRINLSRDIKIADRVWCGREVTILKGAFVNENSVIAANATVAGRFEDKNVVIGGLPAKIIKREIDWNYDREYGERK